MKKKTIKISIYGAVIFVILILFIACGPDVNTLTYKVTGTASTVNVTFRNVQGGIEQRSNVSLPWSLSFDVEGYGQFVSISAQNQGNTGSVTVSILANGNERRTSTSEGAFVIASTSGTWGFWDR